MFQNRTPSRQHPGGTRSLTTSAHYQSWKCSFHSQKLPISAILPVTPTRKMAKWTVAALLRTRSHARVKASVAGRDGKFSSRRHPWTRTGLWVNNNNNNNIIIIIIIITFIYPRLAFKLQACGVMRAHLCASLLRISEVTKL